MTVHDTWVTVAQHLPAAGTELRSHIPLANSITLARGSLYKKQHSEAQFPRLYGMVPPSLAEQSLTLSLVISKN